GEALQRRSRDEPCHYARRDFFFSSRRRHTRCLSDWSSDVCSSDLIQSTMASQLGPLGSFVGRSESAARQPKLGENVPHTIRSTRSEERRVGKECRARRWPAHGKETKSKIQTSRDTPGAWPADYMSA